MIRYWKTDDEVYQGDAYGEAEELTKEQFDEYMVEFNNKIKISTFKQYLTDTDYIYPTCLELGLDVNLEYPDVVAQRKLARSRIQELEV